MTVKVLFFTAVYNMKLKIVIKKLKLSSTGGSVVFRSMYTFKSSLSKCYNIFSTLVRFLVRMLLHSQVGFPRLRLTLTHFIRQLKRQIAQEGLGC